MKLNIIAVGEKMPEWIALGLHDYLKRFPVDVNCQIKAIPAAKRGKSGGVTKWLQQEATLIQGALSSQSVVVVLAVNGHNFSTETLAKKLTQWQLESFTVDFIIGGADGLSPIIYDLCSLQWSLSALTMPHPLVRVLLVEQLYRAVMINKNHPYHRAN